MRRPILALTTGLVLVACGGAPSAPADAPDRPPSTVRFEGTEAVLYVDIADSDGERRRGLMNVEHLPEEEGMAFLYPEPVGGTFWMKDTLIPLSIAFVGPDGTVVGMRDMEPCEADPCPHYGVEEPYVLAIEANQGWFDEHGIEVGDEAELREAADG
jgi:uncharacterized membrane protein (UPF0127 family)